MRLNPQHLEELMRLVNSSPYFRLLAMAITEIGVGYAIIKTNIDTRHLSPYGAIQGGVYASIIDAAAYWAIYAELDAEAGLITLDVNVNNLASVREGELTIRGQRIKTGKTIGLAEAIVTDETGKVLAHGSSKLLITRGLQTINQIAQAAGITLAPKFS